MKNITIIITILSTVFKLSAQDENNLVLNPSFESVDGKLKKLTQIYLANDWDSPNPHLYLEFHHEYYIQDYGKYKLSGYNGEEFPKSPIIEAPSTFESLYRD